MRILYRVRQFRHTLSRKIDPQSVDRVRKNLTLPQSELFDTLQASEKNHALTMVNKLLDQGESQPDLLVAALLHDIGKLRYRLNPFERAMIVIGQAVMPAQAKSWGSIPPGGRDHLPGWRKAFILAEHHAEWGAEMARLVGASPLTVELIRLHHSPPLIDPEIEEYCLQKTLWLVDNES